MIMKAEFAISIDLMSTFMWISCPAKASCVCVFFPHDLTFVMLIIQMDDGLHYTTDLNVICFRQWLVRN